jgi:hypothetical protein
VVGKRSKRVEVIDVSRDGLFRSDYPDISSALKPMRSRFAENLRFPGEGNSAQG